VNLEPLHSHIVVKLPELMVPSNEPHTGGIKHLERKEQAHNLQLVLASVDKIAVEHVPACGC
jgi:hypothetical protein